MRQNTLILALACFIIFLDASPVCLQSNDFIIPDEPLIEQEGNDFADRINDHIPDNQLDYFQNYPLDLNHASQEAILNFPLLTDFEAQKINHYLSIHKPLRSIYELQSIPGISTGLLKKLIPYIIAEEPKQKIGLLQAMTKKNHTSLICRWSSLLQKSIGYASNDSVQSKYLGSPDHLLIRLKSTLPGKCTFAITAEKDAGEPIFNSHIPGFDFISAYLHFENVLSNIQSLIIGDYTLRLGQGLILDNGFNIGKNDQFGSIVKTPSTIKPYQSIRESEMLRGIAFKMKLNKKLDLLLFYSSKRMDGNIIVNQNINSNHVQMSFSSLQKSGLHRTLSELADKNTVHVDYTGMAMDYAFDGLRIGLNGVYKKQNPAISKDNRLDRLFISDDMEQYFSSIHHQWIFKNLTLCGEWALNKNRQHAVIENAILSLGKNAEVMFSHRNFDPGFYNELSNTISASGMSWNEKSNYFALNLSPITKLQINGSIDFTRFPWLKYQNDLLSGACSYSLKIQYKERKKWQIYLQYRRKDSEIDGQNPLDTKEKINTHQSNDQLRLHLETKLNSDWTWRSRIEIHRLEEDGKVKNGMLLSQDLLFKSLESRYSANFRFAIFDISDYSARIYSFENDVMYQYDLPAYNGRGIRAYINFRIKPISRITLESKLSTTCFFDANQNGSALDKIESSYKTELKFQIQFHL